MIDAEFGPDLYRRNAFRVTGLPVTATAKTAKRKRREMELGSAPAVHGPMPLAPPPSTADVGRALARLDDPRSRIVDELTWVWQQDGTSVAGVMLSTDHDRTVLAHCRALDLEVRAHGPLPPELARERDGAWVAAMRGWAALVDRDALWQHLAERAKVLDDPRLSYEDVLDLRGKLRNELLTVSATLAVQQARDASPDVGRHRMFMLELAGAPQVDGILGKAAAPLVRQVDDACAATDAGSADDMAAAHGLVERTRPPLEALGRLLPDGHATRSRLSDEVARRLRRICVAHVNGVLEASKTRPPGVESLTATFRTADGLLRTARSLVHDAAERGRIDTDIATITKMLGSLPSPTAASRPGRPVPSRPPAPRPGAPVARPSPGPPLVLALLAIVFVIIGVANGVPALAVIAGIVGGIALLVALGRSVGGSGEG